MECQSFCLLLVKEAGFIDPTVRKMKLSALEEHCESLHGGVVSVRPIAKKRTEEEEEDAKVLTGPRVIEVHLPGIPSSPTCVGEGVDRGTDRGVQVELMNRLYRMSPPSSSSLSSLGDSHFGQDGSWE